MAHFEVGLIRTSLRDDVQRAPLLSHLSLTVDLLSTSKYLERAKMNVCIERRPNSSARYELARADTLQKEQAQRLFVVISFTIQPAPQMSGECIGLCDPSVTHTNEPWESAVRNHSTDVSKLQCMSVHIQLPPNPSMMSQNIDGSLLGMDSTGPMFRILTLSSSDLTLGIIVQVAGSKSSECPSNDS